MNRGTTGSMDQVGKSFVFDYGQFSVRVRYLSDTKLAWEQVKGPDAGRQGKESYQFVAIRPQVYFIWWQEKDTSVVTQVVDFQERKVYTTWVTPDRKAGHVQGTIGQA